MKYFALHPLVLLVGSHLLATGVFAFCPHPSFGKKTRTSLVVVAATQEANYPHREFHRAIECAENPGHCDVDEMLKLADDLEKYDECFFEKDDPKLCDKEKMDRMDVADLLRLKAEVMLREDYLENANLFKADVEQSRNKENWEEHKQEIDWYSNY